jgi:hypothetical protein
MKSAIFGLFLVAGLGFNPAWGCTEFSDAQPLAFLDTQRCEVRARLTRIFRTSDAERRFPGFCDMTFLKGNLIERSEASQSGAIYSEARVWTCGNDLISVPMGTEFRLVYEYRVGHSLVQPRAFPGTTLRLQIYASRGWGNLPTWGEFKAATEGWLELQVVPAVVSE